MKIKNREKITLHVLYERKEHLDIVSSLRMAGISEIEIIVHNGSLRPYRQFPFIKDEEGRPYYGGEGINFYLRRLREDA